MDHHDPSDMHLALEEKDRHQAHHSAQAARSRPVAARKVRVAVAFRLLESVSGWDPSQGSHLPPMGMSSFLPRRPTRNWSRCRGSCQPRVSAW